MKCSGNSSKACFRSRFGIVIQVSCSLGGSGISERYNSTQDIFLFSCFCYILFYNVQIQTTFVIGCKKLQCRFYHCNCTLVTSVPRLPEVEYRKNTVLNLKIISPIVYSKVGLNLKISGLKVFCEAISVVISSVY